ncbi:MAG: formylglycine-generating enzyme family protein [Gemmataceae bacterium]|nr:formylglycine-generating enzyme family protein [Gemmataceae bacterium]
MLALILALGQAPMIGLPFDADRAARLRTEWAKAHKLEESFTNGTEMKLVLVPGGRFDLGPKGSKWRVALSKPYFLGATEVTLGQYRKWKPGHKVPGAEEEFNADDRPAAFVSWDDAAGYCKWLSDQPAEKKAGRVYRLPTEAQWEWAARAGTATTRHFGDTDKGQERYCWFNQTYTPNPKHEGKGRGRQPAGKKPPNAWGLHDMLGNVWEWVADRREDEATGEKRDPAMRGGSWRSGAFHCTSEAFDPGAAGTMADNIGFRVACRVGR